MPQSIAEVHPELFHYTNVLGLKGIIESQTLWATHHGYLNDSHEILEFQPRLLAYLRPHIEAHIEKLISVPANRDLVAKNGGKEKIVLETVPTLIAGIFTALLGKREIPPFSEPYITSFSTATDPNVAEHGLLSQWRSYGQDGGYAIVFDTLGMEQLLKAEAEKWGHDIIGGDVIYSNATESELVAEFAKELAVIQDSVQAILHGDLPDEQMYPALLMCACRYKHWGFREEQEVRLISALPVSEEVQTQMNARGLPLKPRHFRTRSGTTVPYLALFDGITGTSGRSLPIKRIIVGPHSDGENRKRAVQLLLRQHSVQADVSVSAIPYVG